MRAIKEAAILAHAKRQSKRLGLRFIRLSMRQGVEVGWPDVLILGPVGASIGDGKQVWFETKAPGKPLKPIQMVRRSEIESRGGLYDKPDTIEAVDAALHGFVKYCLAHGGDV